MSTTPTPPEHLDEQAKDKWLELLPTLPDQEPATLDALTAYATAWARMVQAERQVSELGVVIRSAQGFPVENPYLRVAQRERRAVRQLASELKLLPIARRVVRPAREDKA